MVAGYLLPECHCLSGIVKDNGDTRAVYVAVVAFALTVGAFILLGVLSFAAFLALGSSILFAGTMYILTLSRTAMRRMRPAGTHVD